MGLIRKSLFVGSGGIVSPNSKKQRQANAQIRLQKQTLKTMQGQAPGTVRRPSQMSLGEVLGGALWEPPVPRLGRDEPATSDTLKIRDVNPSRKYKVLKTVRKVTGTGQQRSLAIIDSHGYIVCKDKERARDVRVRLEKAGASVEFSDVTEDEKAKLLRGETLEDPNVKPAADDTDSASLGVELERLTRLHQQGALSDEEFAAAKRKMLD